MPRYRFILPVRAIGGYRLPEGGLTADRVTLTPAVDPAYSARVDNIQAENVVLAYQHAQKIAEHFFGYLALLGEDAAFILDGKEGLRARNVDLEENPVPPDQPPPRFESIGGVITEAGQQQFGAMLDPDGSKRRSGIVVVHNAQGLIIPGQERLNQLSELFRHRGTAPARVRIALEIIHDAACAREFANGFAQSYTALEVLTEHLKPPSVLDVFYQQANEQGTVAALLYETKATLLAALRGFLVAASVPGPQAERISNYASMAQSISQVDVFREYLASLGIEVARAKVSAWRAIRGGLVHAAAGNEEQTASMRRFREVVRVAVLEELQRAAAPAG